MITVNDRHGIFLKCSRVAVIGGGSAGIAAAKYLKAEKCFESIVVYEQRSADGGLWQYTPHQRSDAYFSIPQTCPELGPEQATALNSSSHESTFVTPVYDALETNIPRHLMELSDFHFSSHIPLFPSHSEVLRYLQAYARDVKDFVLYNSQVLDIHPCHAQHKGSSPEATGWSVKSLDVTTDLTTVNHFDAVVVANGHYSVPYVPEIPGLRQWHEQRPGTITHSKYFRTAHDFVNKKVIVVGNSASGLDIAAQMESVCKLPVYMSQKSVSDMAAGPHDQRRVQVTAEMKRVDTQGGKVEFVDGRLIDGVDAILFCTGYFCSYPFLRSALPELITDGDMVNGTYQHIFLASQPSLAFLGLPQKVIPFPIAELQAAVMARVFAGRLALPTQVEMRKWEHELLEKRGRNDRFHTFGFPSDAEYMDMLGDWADKAAVRSGLENGGTGKKARNWTAKERWTRKEIPKIKQAYVNRGDERFSIRSIEALGFHYDNDAESRAL